MNIEIAGGTFTEAINFGLLVVEPRISGPEWIVLHISFLIFFTLFVVLRVQTFRYLLVRGDVGTWTR